MRMEPAFFRRIVWASLSAHLVFFVIFGFSFGRVPERLGYAQVSFLGTFLRQADLTGFIPVKQTVKPFSQQDTAALEKANKDYTFLPGNYLKPQVTIPLESRKQEYLPDLTSHLSPPKRKDAVIIFHPQLPEDFLLYFQDRQEVHIELMFMLNNHGDHNSIVIKRKISSGNLEADLLAMRYIHHYLFLQEARLPPNSWQKVKIDLGLKGNK